MPIGDRIKKARLAAGLSQSELAKRMGISTNGVCQWEKGRRAPKVETVYKIAECIGCSPFDILATGDEETDTMLTPSEIDQTIKRIIPLLHILNSIGKNEAVKRMSELTEISKYKMK